MKGLAKDTTEIKEMLRQSHELARLRLSAGRAAYELHSLLREIQMQLSLAVTQLPEQNPARIYLDQAGQATEEATSMARRLMNDASEERTV